MGYNWNMQLLYEGGDNIVQSHAACGNNSREASDRGNTLHCMYNWKSWVVALDTTMIQP